MGEYGMVGCELCRECGIWDVVVWGVWDGGV